MKRFLMVLSIIILILSFSISINAEDKLYSFFSKNKIEITKTVIEFTFEENKKINLEDFTNTLLANLTIKPVKVYRLKDKTIISFSDGILCLNGGSRDNEPLIIFYSQQNKGLNIIDNIRRSVLNACAIHGFRPSFSTLIEAKLNKKLNSSEKNKLALDILKVLNARLIDSSEEKNYISLIGYTNFYSNKLKMNDDFFNINIAIRNGSDGCTYILVGNPIISVEY